MTDLYQTNAPYSAEAEEAVIGSVLTNPSAFLTLASFITPEDFYLIRHQYIWQGLLRIVERNEIIDYLTLKTELEAMGWLDEIGGPAYLTHLIVSTPNSTHAEFYGRIVERTAIRRRLMKAADEIKSLAMDEQQDIDAVIGAAETRLFNVTDRQMKREFIALHDAVGEYFDQIEHMMQTQQSAFGVPSGFKDLDQLLGGLQRSDLLIFAGRPGMGKTSFLLSISANAARLGARVAIFTMEMGADQIVQRLISMETGINTQKLRLGQLSPQEYSRFVEAAGRISRFPIFIDDTPALSPIQMRTKCRRLMHEHGLDLVIVDYMQLMNAGGQYQNNRVQEISYISRSLKELARELNVPMFSAAQLSRAVEQRQDKRPVLSDLRESGCLTGDSLVYLPDEGRHVPIRDLVGKSGFRVLSLNEKTWKLEPGLVTNAFSTGVKPVYRLTTRSGRTIRATGNHKFLTVCGWKRLDELAHDDLLAVPRILTTCKEQTLSNSELALLGHMIGDGCALPRHAIQYTTREDDLAEIVYDLSINVFGEAVNPRIVKEKNRNWYQVFMPASYKLTHKTFSPMRIWLESLGIWGLRSYEKHVPEKVFQQPRQSIAHFLRHLWVTDGCIKMRKTSNGEYPTIYYATSSHRLALDVQTLLLALEINSRVKCVLQGSKGRNQYHVILSGNSDLRTFVNEVGTIGSYKSQSMSEIVNYLDTHSENTNRDVIPNAVWRMHVVPSVQSIGMTSRQFQEKLGNAYCGTSLYKTNLSRERALRAAEIAESEDLKLLAQSNVYWDGIASIIPDGVEEVFDLTVDEHHNFVSANIVVHNSIEQDADIVMFLYRDVVYNEATEFPNQADVLVSKHRNGPTGTVSLYFDRSLTKFMDGAVRNVNLGDV